MLTRGVLRRLAIAAGAGLLCLAVAATIGFQDNLFRHAMDPRKPFQITAPPPAPNYANEASWAARPTAGGTIETAIFFVHPTSFWGASGWNAPIDGAAPARRTAELGLPNFAGPFERLGAIWAPRYRQAALYSFLTIRYDARRARALAYEDVSRAFAQFLAEAPTDAAIVIVGVDQGGLHVSGLLQDMAKAKPIASRLAAAYVIDHAVPLDAFDGPLAALSACAAPDSVRCVVAYSAFREDQADDIRRFRNRSMTWTEDGLLEETAGRALACVNPILGAASEDYAPGRLHRGGVNATGFSADDAPAPISGQTSAQCDAGVLLVDKPSSPSLRRRWSWGERFKPAPFNLFYADLEADAARRLKALRAIRAEEPQDAPPLTDVIEILDAPVERVPN